MAESMLSGNPRCRPTSITATSSILELALHFPDKLYGTSLQLWLTFSSLVSAQL